MENAHRMYLEREQEDGTGEWYCPTCGRRILLSWPPNYHREVLNEGDVSVQHIATRSANDGMNMTVELEKDADLPPQANDPWLGPFAEWMHKRGNND